MHGSSVEISSDLEQLSLSRFSNRALSVSAQTPQLRYQSTSLGSSEGISHYIYLDTQKDDLVVDHRLVHRIFDRRAQEIRTALGLSPEPFDLWLVPDEIMLAMSENIYPGYFTDRNGIVVNYSIGFDEAVNHRLNHIEAMFIHEYTHHLLTEWRGECLEEGLAKALTVAYGRPRHGFTLLLEPLTRRPFSDGCQGLVVDHSKGECVLWHLQQHAELDAALLAALFRHAPEVEQDNCDLDYPSVGLEYFRYLSKAAGRNLAGVLEDAKIPLPISYEDAKTLSLEEIDVLGQATEPEKPWWLLDMDFGVIPQSEAHFFVDLNSPLDQTRRYRFHSNRFTIFDVESIESLVDVSPKEVWFAQEGALYLSISAQEAEALGPGRYTDQIVFKDRLTGTKNTRDVHVEIVANAARQMQETLFDDLPSGVYVADFPSDPVFLDCSIYGANCAPSAEQMVVCKDDGQCEATQHYDFRWTLNGQPFEPFTTLFYDGVNFPDAEDYRFGTNGIRVSSDLPFLHLAGYRATQLGFGPGEHHLAYQGTTLESNAGTSHLVRLPGVGPEALSNHAALHQQLDETAQEITDLTGTINNPYEAWILPPELIFPLNPSGRSFWDPSMGLFVSLHDSLLIPSEFEYYKEVSVLDGFAHEYVHFIYNEQGLNPREEDCLKEGLAEAIASYLFPWRKELSPRGEDLKSKRHFFDGCTSLVEADSRGQCMMWHLQKVVGLSHGLFYQLFHPPPPTDFDSCDLEDPEVGMAYLRYFSRSVGWNVTDVLESAQVPLPLPYDMARQITRF